MNDSKLVETLEHIAILIGRLGNGQNVHYDGLVELYDLIRELKENR
jgi:hypothetical protein